MNRKIKILAVLPLVFLCVFSASMVFGQGKLRVAVVAFENNSTWSYWGG